MIDSSPTNLRSDLNVTVLIATKDRKNDLRRAIESALSQTVALEVLVIDDGSTDGTTEMVHTHFPTVRIESKSESRGYIARRNEGASLARGTILLSIDDDAAFSTPYIVEQTLRDFEDDGLIGAVAVPYVDVRRGKELLQVGPDEAKTYITSDFRGTAYAMRKELFCAVGGYRETLFHQGEERDLCLRLLDAGHVVRLGTSDPIHHFESPTRDTRRMDIFGRRNDILFAWYNIPIPHLFPHLVATTFNGVRFGVRSRRIIRTLMGLIRGYGVCLRTIRDRNPVSRATYRLHRQLRKETPVALQGIRSQLSHIILRK